MRRSKFDIYTRDLLTNNRQIFSFNVGLVKIKEKMFSITRSEESTRSFLRTQCFCLRSLPDKINFAKALFCNGGALLCLRANSKTKHHNEITLKDFSDIKHKEKVIDFRNKLLTLSCSCLRFAVEVI